jgi:hypothetical protein
MKLLTIRFIIGIALLLMALVSHFGWLSLASFNTQQGIAWKLLAGAGAAVLFHAIVDAVIGLHAKCPSGETVRVPKYRMENKRLLSNGLIVTSGVIIGLAKNRGGAFGLDTVFLAAGIVFGFVNLSVHGGAVHDELDEKTSSTTGQPETTLKFAVVEEFHDQVSTILLNVQFLALILGIASLR